MHSANVDACVMEVTGCGLRSSASCTVRFRVTSDSVSCEFEGTKSPHSQSTSVPSQVWRPPVGMQLDAGVCAASPCGRFVAVASGTSVLIVFTKTSSPVDDVESFTMSHMQLAGVELEGIVALVWRPRTTVGSAGCTTSRALLSPPLPIGHAMLPAMLVALTTGHHLLVWQESEPWNPLSFGQVGKPQLVAEPTRSAVGDVTVAWAAPALRHDRLHWAWDSSAMLDVQRHIKPSDHASAMPPPVQELSRAAFSVDSAALDSSITPHSIAAASFPIPRNIISRARRESFTSLDLHLDKSMGNADIMAAGAPRETSLLTDHALVAWPLNGHAADFDRTDNAGASATVEVARNTRLAPRRYSARRVSISTDSASLSRLFPSPLLTDSTSRIASGNRDADMLHTSFIVIVRRECEDLNATAADGSVRSATIDLWQIADAAVSTDGTANTPASAMTGGENEARTSPETEGTLPSGTPMLRHCASVPVKSGRALEAIGCANNAASTDPSMSACGVRGHGRYVGVTSIRCVRAFSPSFIRVAGVSAPSLWPAGTAADCCSASASDCGSSAEIESTCTAGDTRDVAPPARGASYPHSFRLLTGVAPDTAIDSLRHHARAVSKALLVRLAHGDDTLVNTATRGSANKDHGAPHAAPASATSGAHGAGGSDSDDVASREAAAGSSRTSPTSSTLHRLRRNSALGVDTPVSSNPAAADVPAIVYRRAHRLHFTGPGHGALLRLLRLKPPLSSTAFGQVAHDVSSDTHATSGNLDAVDRSETASTATVSADVVARADNAHATGASVRLSVRQLDSDVKLDSELLRAAAQARTKAASALATAAAYDIMDALVDSVVRYPSMPALTSAVRSTGGSGSGGVSASNIDVCDVMRPTSRPRIARRSGTRGLCLLQRDAAYRRGVGVSLRDATSAELMPPVSVIELSVTRAPKLPGSDLPSLGTETRSRVSISVDWASSRARVRRLVHYLVETKESNAQYKNAGTDVALANTQVREVPPHTSEPQYSPAFLRACLNGGSSAADWATAILSHVACCLRRAAAWDIAVSAAAASRLRNRRNSSGPQKFLVRKGTRKAVLKRGPTASALDSAPDLTADAYQGDGSFSSSSDSGGNGGDGDELSVVLASCHPNAYGSAAAARTGDADDLKSEISRGSNAFKIAPSTTVSIPPLPLHLLVQYAAAAAAERRSRRAAGSTTEDAPNEAGVLPPPHPPRLRDLRAFYAAHPFDTALAPFALPSVPSASSMAATAAAVCTDPAQGVDKTKGNTARTTPAQQQPQQQRLYPPLLDAEQLDFVADALQKCVVPLPHLSVADQLALLAIVDAVRSITSGSPGSLLTPSARVSNDASGAMQRLHMRSVSSGGGGFATYRTPYTGESAIAAQRMSLTSSAAAGVTDGGFNIASDSSSMRIALAERFYSLRCVSLRGANVAAAEAPELSDFNAASRSNEQLPMPWVDCLWALRSDSNAAQEGLYRRLLPGDRPLLWADIRRTRLPLWLQSEALLREATERVARGEYLGGGKKDPFDAALPYLALGASRLSTLRAIFRLAPGQGKIFTFLSRDFSGAAASSATAASGQCSEGERARAAASKNAFALLGQHRYAPAAAFFLLAGRPGQAVKTVATQLADPMTALLVARLAEYNAARGDAFPTPTAQRASAPGSGAGGAPVRPSSVGADFGSLDAAAMTKEAAQVMLATAMGTRGRGGAQMFVCAPRNPVVSKAVVASQPASQRPQSILGPGFDDDDDNYVPPSKSYVHYDGAADDGGSSVHHVPPIAVQQQSTAVSSLQLEPKAVSADDDAVAYVLEAELLSLVTKPSAVANVSTTSAMMSPLPSTVATAPVLSSCDAAAIEYIALWCLRRPLAATAALCGRTLLGCVGADVASFAVGQVAVLTAKRPAVVARALTSLLRSQAPSGSCKGTGATSVDWTNAINALSMDANAASDLLLALHCALGREFVAAGQPLLAWHVLCGDGTRALLTSLVGGNAAGAVGNGRDTLWNSTQGDAAEPSVATSVNVKRSIFADFDAPPPSSVQSSSSSVLLPSSAKKITANGAEYVTQTIVYGRPVDGLTLAYAQCVRTAVDALLDGALLDADAHISSSIDLGEAVPHRLPSGETGNTNMERTCVGRWAASAASVAALLREVEVLGASEPPPPDKNDCPPQEPIAAVTVAIGDATRTDTVAVPTTPDAKMRVAMERALQLRCWVAAYAIAASPHFLVPRQPASAPTEVEVVSALLAYSSALMCNAFVCSQSHCVCCSGSDAESASAALREEPAMSGRTTARKCTRPHPYFSALSSSRCEACVAAAVAVAQQRASCAAALIRIASLHAPAASAEASADANRLSRAHLRAVMSCHSWFHLVLVAGCVHDWGRLLRLLHAGPTVTLEATSTVSSTLNRTVREAATGVRQGGYFALRPSHATFADAIAHEDPRALAVHVDELAVSSSNPNHNLHATSPAGADAESPHLEAWLDGYTDAVLNALISAAVAVAVDDAGAPMPGTIGAERTGGGWLFGNAAAADGGAASQLRFTRRIRAWRKKAAVIVSSAEIRLPYTKSCFEPARRTPPYEAASWAPNDGPRRLIIAGLTGVSPVELAQSGGAEGSVTTDAAFTMGSGGGGGGGGGGWWQATRSLLAHSSTWSRGHFEGNLSRRGSNARSADVSAVSSGAGATASPSPSMREQGSTTREAGLSASALRAPWEALWVWLGGPGVFWTAGTERRAISRAASRAAHAGFLPDVKATQKLQLRPHAVMAAGYHGGTPSATTAVACFAMFASPPHPSVLGTGAPLFQPPQLLLAPVSDPGGGVVHATLTGPKQHRYLGRFNAASLVALDGRTPVASTMQPVASAASASARTTDAAPPTSARGGNRLLNQLRDWAHPQHTGAHSPFKGVVSLVASGDDATTHSPLNTNTAVNASLAGAIPTPVDPPLTRVDSIGGNGPQHLAPLSKHSVDPEAHAQPHHQSQLRRMFNAVSHGLVMNNSTITRPHAPELTSTMKIESSDVNKEHVAPVEASLRFQPTHSSLTPTLARRAVRIAASGDDVAAALDSAELSPTAALFEPHALDGGRSSGLNPIAVIDDEVDVDAEVLPTARVEFALPFTLPPVALAVHPSAPMYARGGPEGTIALCSIALEPAPSLKRSLSARDVESRGSVAGAGANPATAASNGTLVAAGGVDDTVDNDGGGLERSGKSGTLGRRRITLQHVHRLQSVLSYRPLPSACGGGVASTTATLMTLGRPPVASARAVQLSSGSGAATSGHSVGGAPPFSRVASTGSRLSTLASSGLATATATLASGFAAAFAGTSARASAMNGSGLPAGGNSAFTSTPVPASPRRGSAANADKASSFFSTMLDASGLRAGGTDESTSSVAEAKPMADGAGYLPGVNLDEAVTRLRWSESGDTIAACFASGVVRLWDTSRPSHPAHTLSTSGAHALLSTAASPTGASGDCDESDDLGGGTAHPFRGERIVWAATDVAFMTRSAKVLAASAAPLFPRRAPVMPAEPPSPARRVAVSGRVQGTAGGFMASRVPSFTDLALTGYGLLIFDVRTSNAAPIATALPYPAFSGVTALLWDDCAGDIIAGCEDGALIAYDVRAGAVRVHVPGVPLTALSRSAAFTRGTPPPPQLSRRASVQREVASDSVPDAASASGAEPAPHSVRRRSSLSPPIVSSVASHPSAAVPAAAATDASGSTVPPMPATFAHYGHAGAIRHIALHPNQRALATGGHDGDVRLWSIPDLGHHCVTLQRLHTAIDFNLAGGVHHGHRRSSALLVGATASTPVAGDDEKRGSTPGRISSSDSVASTTGAGSERPVPPIRSSTPVAGNLAVHGLPSWAAPGGITGLAVTEDYVVSSGWDGAVLAVRQSW